MRVAEHQSAHPRGREMQDVEAVPVITHQLILFRKGQSCAMDAFVPQCAATHDNRGAFCCFQRIGQGLGCFCQSRQIIAQPLNLIGQVSDRPDGKHFRPAFAYSLLDACIHESGFTAQIAADEQDHIGVFDARDGCVEIDCA